ncbi:hypothetical protein [Micromonospora craterilacus]|nr:hypothetical protein [Micromonospora craterilacus]
MRKRAADNWSLSSGYSLWLEKIASERRVATEETEGEWESLVARLMFALLFVFGAVLLVLTLPLMAIPNPVGDVVAAGVALLGVAAVVASLCGGLTDHALAVVRRKHQIAFDIVFLSVTTLAWLLFALTVIYGG